MATPLASQPAPQATTATISGDTTRFIAGNRIHVQHGSLFLDPYLVVHPRELAAGGEAKLKEKLKLTFSLNNPSFYESVQRLPIALNLASLLPVSLESKRSELMKTIEQFNREVKTNSDGDLARTAADRMRPFNAIARDFSGAGESDAVGMETLKSGLTFYLVLREALTRKGYLNRLTDYVRHDQTADQILTSLQDKTGVTSESVMEAARTGGIPGVARALGIDDAYLREVGDLVDRASRREFSYNMIEHWHIGRQLLAGRNASLDDKIAVGMERRMLDTMQQLKAKAKGQTDVPPSVKEKEQWVADGLKMLPPIQRQLLWDLGYEIGYTDDITADKISFHPNVYGLHRQTKDNLADLRGTYRIYFAGKGDTELSRRTLVHEVTHNLWPNLFTPKDIEAIDTLANRDRMRLKSITSVLEKQFDTFKGFVDAYHARGASPQQQQAVLQQANQYFGSTLGDVSGLIAENKDAFTVLHMTQHANDRLHIDGKLYKQSGYHGAQERFREVISRFSELRYVRLREQPQLMQFIAPNLSQVYDQYYLPHLEKLHMQIMHGPAPAVAGHTAAVTADNEPTKVPVPGPEQPQPATQGKRIDIPGGRQETVAAEEASHQASKNPSVLLMGGEGAGAERQLAALQVLNTMGVHV